LSVFIAVASSLIVSVIDYQKSLSSLNFMANKATVSLIVMGVSVCLAVRPHISETTRPILTEFSLRPAGDRGSCQLWQRCDTVRTSGVDYAMFAHNWSGKGDRKAYLLCHVHRAGYKRSFEWALRLTIMLQLNPAVKCRSWFFLGGGALPSFKGKNKNILHWHRIST